MDIFELTKIYGDRVKDDRTFFEPYAHGRLEYEELRQEILNHYTDTPSGKDGIIGEAIDVIACMVDVIQRYDPNFTNEEFKKYYESKLIKWENKYNG